MIRKILLVTLLICAFALAFTFRTQPIRAAPDDIYVPYDYPTIQAAINNATTGDIIHVAGTYHEHVTINKSVNLVGEGEAIINGDGTGTIINVTANGVLITNFKIRNAGQDWGNKDSGIKLLDRSTCYVMGNQINNSRIGIYVEDSTNILVQENTVTNTTEGILIERSPSNRIESNTLQNNSPAIFLDGANSKLNLIKNNTIRNGIGAIHLQSWSSNNTIIYNWAINNTRGIYLSQSENNTIYHNNFINNTEQAGITPSSQDNTWHIDWPTGGNHWSSHTSADNFNGQYQNQAGSDGICDTPCTVYGTDIDMYPLMGPISLHEVPLGFITETVKIISNSTVSNFQMNITQRTMNFTVTGATGKGFCRVDVPNTIVAAAWEYDFTVLVDGEAPLYLRNWTQGSMTYIYFAYQHSEHEVIIIPELQAHLLMAFFMTATLITFAAHKRKQIT